MSKISEKILKNRLMNLSENCFKKKCGTRVKKKSVKQQHNLVNIDY